MYVQADLTKESDIKNIFNQIKEKYGKLDILINNAGRTFNIPFKEITEESIARDINTNLTSAILCSKYATELINNEGWIVNTSSIRGIDYSGRAGIIGYCSAKAGINSFTKTLAMELAPKIYVNAVAPGFVYTNYMNTVTDEMKQSWLKNIPINKFIEPREIAEVYLMLATSKIFTGSIVTPDGGYSLLNR
ncbi:MAG: SDR family oxidoreductase [Clostridia bacterium]|nr:SDR family oxidoreductase [Clostridia bacterium]